MPIPSQTPYAEHTGNGVTTSFAYEFTVLSADDMRVLVNGSEITTGFTITGVGSRTGGTVVFSTAPASLASIYLWRDVSLAREADYQENGDLLATTLDDDFDRLWMAMQDRGEAESRSLRVPVGETLSELPAAALRASKYLAFDSGGRRVLIDAPSASDASALALALADESDPAKGAGMVGFDASLNYAVGTLGAILNDVCFNVRMFPWLAKGDGIADDTAAIQAAGNAAIASRGRLILPAGQYRVGDLTFTGASGLSIEGVRQPHTNMVGSTLMYTGAAKCLSFATGTGAFLYRVLCKSFAIYFEQDAEAGIYAKNLSEGSFEDVGVWAQSQTVQKGFDLDGVSILNVDNCVTSRCETGINMRFGDLPNPQACGGVNITRNNIFYSTYGIVCGYTLQMVIENNWIEGFQVGVLIDNAAPRLRTEIAGLHITKNSFIQSTNGLSETRAVLVRSADNANSIRIAATIRDNFCFMNSSGAAAPSYAFDVDVSTNTAVVDGRITVENNEVYGVSVAGATGDSDKIILSCTKNKVRDALFGNWLPEYLGVGARLFDMQALLHSSVQITGAATTSETAAKTLSVPANLLGPEGALRITHVWRCTNNANAKTIRARLNDIAGPVMAQHLAASADTVVVTTTLGNRGSVTNQLCASAAIGPAPSVWSNSGALADTRNSTSILLTYQKANAADTISLESVTVETIQP